MAERCEDTPAAPRRSEPVLTKLHRIACKARNEPTFKFTSLFHLMNEELLRGCFARLRGDAAAGIDGKTKADYAENLEENLAGLVKRLHWMGYRPQAVRRVYIPKPGSEKGRPLGILRIPMIPPTCSDGSRPPIPIDSAHPFRRKAVIFRSVATRVI